MNILQNRNQRNRNSREKNDQNGKLYIQIIICIVIICSFILLKDTSLPNGKTPREYAERILSTTVNLPEIIARFKNDVALPAGAEIFKP